MANPTWEDSVPTWEDSTEASAAPSWDDSTPTWEDSAPAEEPSVGRKLQYGFKDADTLEQNAARYLASENPEAAARLSIPTPAEREDRDFGDSLRNLLAPLAGAALGLATSDSKTTVGKAKDAVEAGQLDLSTQSYGEEFVKATPDERREIMKAEKDKILAEEFPDVHGTEYENDISTFVGRLGGVLSSPTTLLPAGSSLKGAAAWGAGIGAADAAIYDLAEEGVIDPTHVAGAAAIGGVVGPALHLAGQGISRAMRPSQKKADKQLVETFQSTLDKARSEGISPNESWLMAKYKTGLSDDALEELVARTGKKFEVRSEPEASRTLAALQNRSSGFLGRAKETADDFLTPISTTLRKYDPQLFHAVRSSDAWSHFKTHEYFERTNAFSKAMKKLPRKYRYDMKRALFEGDANTINRIITEAKTPQLREAFKDVRKVLDEIHADLKKAGYKIEYRKNYFPSVVKDVNKVSKLEHGTIQDALRKAKKANNDEPLTPRQVGDVIDGLIQGRRGARFSTSGSLKKRTRATLPDELMDAYADPVEALHSYIRSNVHDIQRRKVFRKQGYKGKPDPDGKDIEKALGHIMGEKVASGKLSHQQANEIVGLLRARYGPGENAPHKFIQGFKDLTYASLLGNPFAAAIQLGDLAIASSVHGARNVVASLFGKKYANVKTLGLTDAAQEFASTSGTKSVLNFTFKWGGFTAIDRMGKNANINAAMRKAMTEVKTQKGRVKFREKWGKYFEGETEDLISALQKGEVTDNVRLLMWHELADVQPIALSEMPKKYLEHPNGRIAYMLQSFTIKQMDIMRRKVLREWKAGNKVKAARFAFKFALTFTAANMSIDMTRDWMVGKEVNPPDYVIDNLLRLFALNKYTIDKAGREGGVQTFMEFFLPPATPYDDILSLEPDRMGGALPIVGPFAKAALKEDE